MREEQLDLFYEADPELKERAQRANFRVSILGGGAGKEIATQLGYQLTKEFFPVQTGGYSSGTMEGALEGANRAIEEMEQNPKTKELLEQTYPFPRGIGVEEMAPELMYKAKHVKTELEEGEAMGHYTRLGRLIEESSVNIVLPGGTGTEIEAMADLRFSKKLRDKYVKDPKVKPLIFTGDEHDELLKEKFEKTINKSDYIYKTHSAEETVALVNALQQLENNGNNLSKEKQEELNELREKYLLRFKDED